MLYIAIMFGLPKTKRRKNKQQYKCYTLYLKYFIINKHNFVTLDIFFIGSQAYSLDNRIK